MRAERTDQRVRRGPQDTPFFSMMKEMTLVGYYTSEIGATEELQFQPATDKFEGCIPPERNGGRTWAEIG